jgi:hypothetical protein
MAGSKSGMSTIMTGPVRDACLKYVAVRIRAAGDSGQQQHLGVAGLSRARQLCGPRASWGDGELRVLLSELPIKALMPTFTHTASTVATWPKDAGGEHAAQTNKVAHVRVCRELVSCKKGTILQGTATGMLLSESRPKSVQTSGAART